jgi:hypothetical protein
MLKEDVVCLDKNIGQTHRIGSLFVRKSIQTGVVFWDQAGKAVLLNR